jgi:hypothetical protein
MSDTTKIVISEDLRKRLLKAAEGIATDLLRDEIDYAAANLLSEKQADELFEMYDNDVSAADIMARFPKLMGSHCGAFLTVLELADTIEAADAADPPPTARAL